MGFFCGQHTPTENSTVRTICRNQSLHYFALLLFRLSFSCPVKALCSPQTRGSRGHVLLTLSHLRRRSIIAVLSPFESCRALGSRLSPVHFTVERESQEYLLSIHSTCDKNRVFIQRHLDAQYKFSPPRPPCPWCHYRVSLLLNVSSAPYPSICLQSPGSYRQS